MIRLSIIVPLYNSANYIRKCLDSLLKQDIPSADYEIIFVNDGSPDNSFDIVLSYKEEYANIILVSQENKGTSGARNTGIDIAQGKYIAFVDPDDYVQSNIYKSLLDKMEEDNLDMLRSDYSLVDENYNLLSKPKGGKGMSDYSDEVVDGKVFLSKKLGYACFVWLFIYRSSIIKDNQLYYQKDFYIDDTEWLPRVLIHAHRVTSIVTPYYSYVQHLGSLMNTDVSSRSKIIEGCFTAIEMLNSETYKNTDIYVRKWYKGMISVIVIGLLNIISTNNEKEIYLNRLSCYNVFPLSSYRHSTHLRLKIILTNISPKLYCWYSAFKKF